MHSSGGRRIRSGQEQAEMTSLRLHPERSWPCLSPQQDEHGMRSKQKEEQHAHV